MNGSATATLTDTYEFTPGQLTVTKRIEGPAAGQQDPVSIEVFCGGQQLDPVFEVPAGATGEQAQTYTGIPAGTECTVVETQDGRNATVDVTVQGRSQEVSVSAGGTATAEVTDTYTSKPGSLLVRKTIGGEAAPLRGEVRIEVDCDDGVTRDPFVIPAAADRSGDEIRIYSDIPAGTSCTVTETADGATDAALVTVQGSGQQVTIPAAGAATTEITDTYDFAPGDLVIGKVIAGPAAGQQDEIVLRPVCDGVALPPFVIPAGTPAGLVTHTYTGLPAGAECTGSETRNGTRGPIVPRVQVVGSLPKTIPPGGSARVIVVDAFRPATNAITVHKSLHGPAAGRQGRIVISTECDGTTLPPLVIPAGSAAGTRSRTYSNLTPGASCTVRETSDGSTSGVDVRSTGDGQSVVVPVTGNQDAFLTNTVLDVTHGTQAAAPVSGFGTTGATLPDTGAPAHTRSLLVAGFASSLLGSLLLLISRRRRNT